MTTPYAFQKEDVRRMHEDFGGRCLVAWEQGLGKTFAALLYARDHCKGRHIVVVCPWNVKAHWEAEARRHVGMRAEVLEGRTPPDRVPPSRGKIWVINYDIVGSSTLRNTWLKFLKSLNPGLVVIDEVQNIMNLRAKRSRGVRALCVGVKKIVGTSGTPLVNRPIEMFSIANLLRPDVPEFSTLGRFAMKFTKPRRSPWGWEYKGAKNLDLLHRLLSENLMLRRRKEEVMADLPKCTRVVVPFRLGPKEAKEYREAETDLIGWLAKTSPKRAESARKAEQVVKFGYLKRLAATLRLDQSMRWINEHLENTGRKLAVYGVHRKVLEPLHEAHTGRSTILTGRTPRDERKAAVDRFITSPGVRLFIGNIRAAGVGIDGLQRATSDLAFIELGWTPGEMEQARCRIDRIGQTLPTFAWYFVAEGTVEEDVCKLLEEKQKVLSQVLDGQEQVDGDLDIFSQLEERLLERSGK